MTMTPEDVEDLIEGWELDPAIDPMPRLVALLETMKPGDPGRCHVLTTASDHAFMRGDVEQALVHLDEADEQALVHLDEAEEDPGDELDYVRAMRISHLLVSGRLDEAEPLLAELRKQNEKLSATARSRVAEALEEAGLLQQAQRWFTMELRDLDPELDEPDVDERLALFGRARTRRALGQPMDAFDRLAEELRAEQP